MLDLNVWKIFIEILYYVISLCIEVVVYFFFLRMGNMYLKITDFRR